ncbi:DUF6074 family protein [Pararhizobium sp.]|uniref:DUF6074 family protein n=1 Tax=Pararhizobium sp. TaxID=1977563 RepID=UPI002725E899|nr:DUF6074 family protein [Pararhizobium sp.]MDO9418573.1 DUF6074 family protein [Pararhizobium sp.]
MNRSQESESRNVVPFPAAKRKSAVRLCAEILDGKQGKEAETYWRTECRSLATRLQVLGCSPEDISAHVMDFQDAVQIELMNLHSSDDMHEASRS